MDQTADPCEVSFSNSFNDNLLSENHDSFLELKDFFQFACGGWINKNEIPDGKSRWGKFYELRDAVDKSVRKIIEAPIADNDPQSVVYMKDHYKACKNLSQFLCINE